MDLFGTKRRYKSGPFCWARPLIAQRTWRDFVGTEREREREKTEIEGKREMRESFGFKIGHGFWGLKTTLSSSS